MSKLNMTQLTIGDIISNKYLKVMSKIPNSWDIYQPLQMRGLIISWLMDDDVPEFIWLVVSTPVKNMKVSWDDEIPNLWENNIHVPNHQPEMPSNPMENHHFPMVFLWFSYVMA